MSKELETDPIIADAIRVLGYDTWLMFARAVAAQKSLAEGIEVGRGDAALQLRLAERDKPKTA